MGWPGSGSITHELGHALLGMSTKDFPEPGECQWNAGDGMHIDSDVVATGVLAGPVWDPVRGFPHPVVVEIDGVRREVYMVREPDGTFVLQPIDDAHGVWADVFLYMMGILPLEETNETYYKLVNPSLAGCWSDEWEFVCPEGTVVQPERVIEFTTADLVARYGPWSARADFTPRDLELGVLNISDRRHTEAEITWFARLYREFAQGTDAHEPFYPSTPWRYSTRGLGQIDVDPSN